MKLNTKGYVITVVTLLFFIIKLFNVFDIVDTLISTGISTFSSNQVASVNNLACSANPTQIKGTVFQDFNYDGIYDTGSDYLGLKGMAVSATDSLGNTLTTETDANGEYTFSALTTNRTYRIAFTFPDSLAWAKSTFYGTDNGTTVQFIQAGNCANLGVSNPADYCEDNPLLGISCFTNGSGVGNTRDGFVSFRYNDHLTGDGSGIPDMFLSGTNVTNPSKDAEVQEVGAVWGGDWQAQNKRAFLSAFSKRHVGFGSRGADGVYVVDYSGTSPTITGGFDLQDIVTTNGGTIDVGSIQRSNVTGSITNDDELSDSPTTPNIDLFAFDAVGKTSFGDAEFEENGEIFWLVNLKQQALIRVDLSNYTPSMANPSILSASIVDQYLMASMPNMPTCTGGELRPWGLKFYKGKAYLGLICDAATSQDGVDLNAFVVSFDPDNPYAGVEVELAFNMDYTRENTDNPGLGGLWTPWISTWAEIDDSNGRQHPQPIISNIDFTDDGNMVIGVMDRFGNQVGVENYIAVSGTSTLSYLVVFAPGDILHACKDGESSWLLEGTGTCATLDNGIVNSLTNDGPSGNGEYYFHDYFDRANPTPDGTYNHAEISTGAVLVLKGKNTVINTVWDPITDNRLFREGTFTQGLHWYNTNTAVKTGAYTLVDRTDVIEIEEFSKANGLGELFSMCSAAPIEIGNYVWLDADKDGVQDAGELGLEGVRMELYDNVGNLLAFDTTNSIGHYSFSGNNIDDATWLTTDDTLSINTTYYIIAGGNGHKAIARKK